MRGFIIALFFLTTPNAYARNLATGYYVCTVDQKAGVGGVHIEGAGPPSAFIARARNRFALSVTRLSPPSQSNGGSYRIEEVPYSGPDRDNAEWQDSNSVLHSEYLGDGSDFTAAHDQGFLRLGVEDVSAGTIWFFHSGFEYPGGEDVNLSVRYGTCSPSSAHNR